MSARIRLLADRAAPRVEVRCIASFRPEARLPDGERRLLARVRALEAMLRARVAESRALHRLLAERGRA